MPLGMIGKYERLDVLGHGVSGIVYLAKDTLLNKQIALKEVDVQAGDLRRFLEEARVMDRLRHPNIVRVNNVDRIEGKVVIDMEYVRGQNLQETLRQEGQFAPDRALALTAQVLDALDYAHQMQTVHRDIKPANILLDRDGQIKLVDFGLAEILATNAYAGGAGTYAYMAPEDFAEDDRSDAQSDIWAVGVTLFEMLTGQRPFNVAKVKDPFAWKRALESEEPTPLAAYLPADTPYLAAMQPVLDRALARDKCRRYQTAGQFRDDLLNVLRGQSLAADTLRPSSIPGARRGGVSPSPASGVPAMDISDTPTAANSRYNPAPGGSSSTMPDWAQAATGNTRVDRRPEQAAANTAYPYPVAGVPLLSSYAGADTEAVQAGQKEAASPPKGRVARLPLSRRRDAVRLLVEPGRVDFGSVRKGELPTVKITARVSGADGDVQGRVTHSSPWLTAHPPAFERARQSITLTAHTERAWETGEFYETVRIETNAGDTEIPVRLIVLPPRPSFFHIAGWYAPLFACVLLPALAIALANPTLHTSAFILGYVPGAAVASGLLALMLLLVSVAADIGIGERLACGVLIAVMCAVLGVSYSHIGQDAHIAHNAIVAEKAVMRAMMIGGFMGGVVLLQLLHLRKWKLWACVVGALGLGLGGALLRILGV